MAGISPWRHCVNINTTYRSVWSFKRDCKTHSFSLGSCSTAFWQDRHEMNYNEYELSLQSGLRIHLSARPVRPLWPAHPYSKQICHQLIALWRTWAYSESKCHKWPHAPHLWLNYANIFFVFSIYVAYMTFNMFFYAVFRNITISSVYKRKQANLSLEKRSVRHYCPSAESSSVLSVLIESIYSQ